MAQTGGKELLLKRTHYCGSVDLSQVGQTVTLMGWAATRRDLGGVVFIDLRDREGICQVVARPEVSKAAHDVADKVRGEYVLAVTGRVDARDADTINPKIKTGTVEITAAADRHPLGSEDPAFRHRRRHQHRRRDPAQVPLSRPATRPHSEIADPSPQARPRHPDVPRRAGLPGNRDPDPHRLHPRGRARLSRSLARPPRLVLRAAPVASDVQAALHGGRPRPVLPDRPLLPRRRPARRPPAGVHPGRHRDVLPARRSDLRTDRAAVSESPRPDRGGGQATVPPH